MRPCSKRPSCYLLLGRLLTVVTLLALVSAHAMGSRPSSDAKRLCDGRFGKAIDLSSEGRYATVSLGDTMQKFPVTFEFWVRLNGSSMFNILLSAAPKSGAHWEIYTESGSGCLSIFIPQLDTPAVRSSVNICDGNWHFIAFRISQQRMELYADGTEVLNAQSSHPLLFDRSDLNIGALQGGGLGCDGAIDELHISRRTDDLHGLVPSTPAKPVVSTLHIYHFDSELNGKTKDDISSRPAVDAHIADHSVFPSGNRFLDEVQDEAYSKSTLHGDEKVEEESLLPVTMVKAEPYSGQIGSRRRQVLSLSGEWLLKESEPLSRASFTSYVPQDSTGVTNGWYRQGFDRSSWRKVHVPTTVQNALVKSGEFPDPFYDANTYDELNKHGIPEPFGWQWRQTRIEAKDWWFARKFRVPDSFKGKSLRLYFDGIDYSASVYLNGHPLGCHAGMFGGPSLDVSRLVKFDAENELVVRVDCAPIHWFGTLKGSPGFGWHYGHMKSVGIWRDVQLEAVAPIEIDSPFVATKSINKKSAAVSVEYYLRSRVAKPQNLTLVGTITGKGFRATPVRFVNRLQACNGESRYRTEISLNNPQLWWPLNYGKQNMYKLQMAVYQDGKPVDEKEVDFGVRTLDMRPIAGSKAVDDYRWQFVINGQPMFIKGANWCWSDPMLQCDPAKYERLLELARRGGIQMFRAWGGGIVETDEFYRLCDEKGIMVYQEFPYCWGPPDFPVTDPAVLDQQVSQVVKRNRNHPSLVMWGGGNENVEPRNADEGLFLVGRRCRQYDPTRPYHRTDPWGGSIHQWGVFHSGQPIDAGYFGTSSVFYGEFGVPSMPNKESTLKFLPEASLKKWPADENNHGVIMHMNQFSIRDLVKTLRYANYGSISTWDQYIEYSQMAQGDAIRFAGEMQRAGSNENKSGFWFYKFTDLFPGHSWAVVDFYGNPKISYYRARQTCRPVAAFASYRKMNWQDGEAFSADLHAANDTMISVKGVAVSAVIFGSDLLPLWSHEYGIKSLPANLRIDLGTISVKIDPAKAKPFLLAVSMKGKDGRLISDQWYWFNFQVKSDAVKEIEKLDSWGFPEERAKDAFAAYAATPEARLLSLPQTKLKVTCKEVGGRGYFSVKNVGDRPAFNVLFDNFPGGYHDFLEDNSFSLRAGEERQVEFELGKGSSLDHVTVRAWNAKSASIH